MASTYSTSLRLELIGTGEQQGTWGTTTNTNLGTLLEEAIGGYTSVTVSDAGDTTLTTNNGSADQARNMVINLSGTLTNTRNVICPAVEKVYIVVNNTTGGFAVTFKTSGGTGISVAAGTTSILFCDGTNVRAALNSTAPFFNTIELGNASDTTITRSSAGVIAVEGGVIPKENRANTFTANQQVNNATNGATSLTVVNTDTGASASAALIMNADSGGLEILARSAAGGDDAIIRTTSASSGGLKLQASAASSDMVFLTGGANERMRIDSSGRVGIGCTPSATIAENALLQVQPRSASGSRFVVSGYDTGSGGTNGQAEAAIYNYNNDAYGGAIYTNYARGTFASPSAVQNGDELGYILFRGHDGTDWRQRCNITSKVDGAVSTNTVPTAMIFATGTTGSTERMRISSAGDVGVGGNSSGAYGKLTVMGSGYQAMAVDSSSGCVTVMAANANSEARVGTLSNHPLDLYVNNSMRMRINTDGVTTLNTTTNAGGAVFTAQSLNGTTNRAIAACSRTASDEAVGPLWVSKQSTTNTTSQVFVQFAVNNGGTASGQINANGASTVAFGTYSDARLKENIEDLPPQLANVMAMRPVEFDYIDGSGHQIGFVAQELQEIYPDVVGERADGMLTVTGWSKTEARLVKALQEAVAKIESLEARVAALENA